MSPFPAYPRQWDLRYFAEPNLPAVVANLDPSFSRRWLEPIRVLDMPVKLAVHDRPAGGYEYRLPDSLAQFAHVIRVAEEAEAALRDTNPLYVYLTVDQKLVPPCGTQRRPGWHSDGFITDTHGLQVDVIAENAIHFARVTGAVDHTYIAYDCLGTWFHPGPFISAGSRAPEIADDVEALIRFGRVASESPRLIRTYPVNTLLRLDPYDVHTGQTHLGDKPLPRTFVKVAFSERRYNRTGNTHNPLFDYWWPMVPRDPGRREHRFA